MTIYKKKEVKDEVIEEMKKEVIKMEEENKKPITFYEFDKLCKIK